jgi:hypothetical protein
MSINTAYDYFSNKEGQASFYYAQYKNNRMREWKYFRDGNDLDVILDDIKQAEKQAEFWIEKGDKDMIRHFKSMRYRIIKLNCQQIPI